MDFMQLAKKRYSCRKFQNKKVNKGDLAAILEAGRIAPTAHNAQPYKILVVESEQGLEIVRSSGMPYNTPLALIICGNKDTGWTRPFDGKQHLDVDTSIITDHMMLEATELGLDSVWICKFDPEIIRKGFFLPDNFVPINILYIGYGDGQPKATDRHGETRKSLEEVVCWEKFS